MRTDASGPVGTGGAGGGVGLRNLNGEQAKSQQAGNHKFHTSLLEFDFGWT
jgi:hypothetical protein